MARRDSILVSRTLYQIGVVSLIASVMWVAVGIYSVTGQEFKTEIDKGVLEPINPVLDQEVIQAMTGRLKVEAEVAPSATPVEIDFIATPEVVETDFAITQESTIGAQQSDTISVDEVR